MATLETMKVIRNGVDVIINVTDKKDGDKLPGNVSESENKTVTRTVKTVKSNKSD